VKTKEEVDEPLMSWWWKKKESVVDEDWRGSCWWRVKTKEDPVDDGKKKERGKELLMKSRRLNSEVWGKNCWCWGKKEIVAAVDKEWRLKRMPLMMEKKQREADSCWWRVEDWTLKFEEKTVECWLWGKNKIVADCRCWWRLKRKSWAVNLKDSLFRD
jgi:hypothetical protein